MILSTFVGQKLLGTSAALAVVLGADVGTTIVAQLFSFDITWLGPLLLLIGLSTFSIFQQNLRWKNIGLAIFGMGLMLFAFGWIREASMPIKSSDALPYILRPLEIDPVLTILLGAVITWLFHSSLAFVMLVFSLVISDVISQHLAFELILGANLGGVMAPLMAALRDQPAALRIPFANFLMRLISVLLVLPFLPQILQLSGQFITTGPEAVLYFHFAFNLLVALIFLPLIGMVSWVVHHMIPDILAKRDQIVPLYLDDKQIEIPVVALSSAARETLRMADIVQDMLLSTINVFKAGDQNLIKEIQEKDTSLDILHRAIKLYLARTLETELSKAEAQRHLQILNFATTIEHIGDAIDKSMMPMARRLIENHRRFSPDGMREIEQIFNLVLQSMRDAQTVFMTSDAMLARKLVESKEAFGRVERAASASHFARLSQGVPETIETSSVHLDLLRDLQRINGDVVTVAYPILEATGELLPNRLTTPRLSSLEPDLRDE
jgi:phosphate:Na+ symporter